MTNACIIYLVRTSNEDLKDFINSLNSLYKNFLQFYDYPVLAFIEESFGIVYQKKLLDSIPEKLNISFETIEFKIPHFLHDKNIPDMYPHPTHGNGPIAWGHPGFPIGYRHMCRFFSGEMYKHPEIIKYDYYMRLDTDSLINSKIPYDIFRQFEQNGYYYGYPKLDKDHPKVVQGLWASSKQYKIDKKIQGNIPPYLGMFYTNFEIGYIPWFLKSGYMKYYDYLDKQGGIYTRRWGDTPIKYIGINMLMKNEHIHHVTCFDYRHGTVKEIDKKLSKISI